MNETLFGSPFNWILFLGITLFWMVVAWRAMRAHERLADSLEKFERGTRPGESGART